MKKDEVTDKRIATPTQRILASNVRQARDGKKGWDSYEKDQKAAITETLNGDVDLTLVTEDGAEVLTLVQGEPTQAMDWARYRKDHPELEPEFEKYLKPATVTTTLYTTWVEQTPPVTE